MTGPDRGNDAGLGRPRQPLFLAQQNYRRRRMMDASRMLPVLGFLLILIPILWRPAETPEPDTAAGLVYLFLVWFGLIVLAFGLSLGLAPATEAGSDDADRPETPG